MTRERLRIVIFGLSITSSWGNGHATTYRALVRQLGARGHEVLFLERETPWYAAHRDLASPPGATTRLYESLADLKARFDSAVAEADAVIVGSFVPEGIAIGEWVTEVAQGVTAFYDIDTPVTLARLSNGGNDYLSRALIPRYRLYLSFTGGPTLERLEREFGSPMARALYCSVDDEAYAPMEQRRAWDLGYLGTYSPDRQPALELLLLNTAQRLATRQFCVVGAKYPELVAWPPNVTRVDHLPPGEHRRFYTAQRYTLNLTRASMIEAGWSPSVRLFEAAACGTPIISDWWNGLDEFFDEDEILIAHSSDEVISYLCELPEMRRLAIADRARKKILTRHTAAHRAAELEKFFREANGGASSEESRGTIRRSDSNPTGTGPLLDLA